MPATPPPLPPPGAVPVPYAAADVGRPFSPWPLAIACPVIVAAFSAVATYLDTRLVQIFKDFKVDLPATTVLAIRASNLLLDYWLWAPALVLAFVLPVVLVPLVPAPASDESRRRVARTVRTVLVLLVLGGIVLVVIAIIAPVLSLASVVTGPSNKR